MKRSSILIAVVALSACAGPQAPAPAATAQLTRCSPREELRPQHVVDAGRATVTSSSGAPVTHGTPQKVTVPPPPDCEKSVAAAPAPKPAPPAEPAAAAVFDPPAGEYAGAQSVALSSATPGAVIHYTTDGSVPTADSPTYTNPIPVEKSTTVRAIAIAPGAPSSAVSSGAYTIAPPPPPPPARVAVAKSRLELKEVVLFETGKATIDQRSYSLLDEVAAALKDHAEVKTVRIEGHTDDVGAAAANMKLSQSRAEAVRAYLVGQGIGADRLTAKGYGESRPVASNTTPDGRTANRRVDFIIAQE